MIRTYKPSDKKALEQIVIGNSPKYFAPSERADFLDFLDTKIEDYFVYVEKGKILGGGGINYGFENGAAARISWDLVKVDSQGKGIGSQMLKYRIDHVKGIPAVRKIIVRTSQFVYPYYQKSGFQLIKKVADYWDRGYDLYLMEMKVNQ